MADLEVDVDGSGDELEINQQIFDPLADHVTHPTRDVLNPLSIPADDNDNWFFEDEDEDEEAPGFKHEMDIESRKLIESMLAEEEFYFGTGSLSEKKLDSETYTASGFSKNETKSSSVDRKQKLTETHNTRWTQEEDLKLYEGITLYGFGNWKQISEFMLTRSKMQIKNRTRHLIDFNIPLPVPGTNGVRLKDLIPKVEKVPKYFKSEDTTKKGNAQLDSSQSNETEKSNFNNLGSEVVKLTKNIVETNNDDDEEEEIDIDISEDDNDLKSSITSVFKIEDKTNRTEILDHISEEKSENIVYNKESVRTTSEIINDNEIENRDSIVEEISIPSVMEDIPSVDPDRIFHAIPFECFPKNDVLPLEISSNAEFFPYGYTSPVNGAFYPPPRMLTRTPPAGKSPDRYMKIRNHILDMWREKKLIGKYLSKSAIRPGLKGMGDVNAISRVHEFLENVGAINENLQSNWEERKKTSSFVNEYDDSEFLNDYESDITFPIDGKRKRRVRSASGWVDPKWLEGHVINHSIMEPDVGSAKHTQKRPRNFRKALEFEYDPFKLIPPKKQNIGKVFSTHNPSEEIESGYQVPFDITVLSHTLAVMDFHAHLARTEIIGLLGGRFIKSNNIENQIQSSRLTIEDVFPCKSVSTGVAQQCEMDPESEMQARKAFAEKELDVVGWYHSHPTFEPDPSIRDLENQCAYQTLFRRQDGIEPFVCVIVSPYDKRNPSDTSKFRFLSLANEWSENGDYRIPYFCSKTITASDAMNDVYKQITTLIKEYKGFEHREDLSEQFKRHISDESQSKLEKLCQALDSHLSVTRNPLAVKALIEKTKILLSKWFCQNPSGIVSDNI
ncbi:Myb-like, SWIRM and MPN domains 1 [Nowakowskiella sp. JEL0078]|nr:Myb-like, SWIRM and MPN domains 1 [Nowakowskiella sp. JEL0078]